MTRRPASSSILVMAPVRLRLVASGLIMEKVRSIAIGGVLVVGMEIGVAGSIQAARRLAKGRRLLVKASALRDNWTAANALAAAWSRGDELALPQSRRHGGHCLSGRGSCLGCLRPAV